MNNRDIIIQLPPPIHYLNKFYLEFCFYYCYQSNTICCSVQFIFCLKWTFLESLTVGKDVLIPRMFYPRSSKFCSLVNAFSSKTKITTKKRNTHKTVIFRVRKKKICVLDFSSFLPFTLYKAFTQMYVSRRTK